MRRRHRTEADTVDVLARSQTRDDADSVDMCSYYDDSEDGEP